MKKALLALLAAVITARIIHLIPPVAVIYHMDTWPLLYDTAQLAKNTPIPLDSNIFDGYNNYWPGIILLAATINKILGIGIAPTLRTAVPLAATILYIVSILTLARNLTRSREESYFAAAIASLFPFEALFHTAPVKEALALPLMITATILLTKQGLRQAATLAILSAAIAFTHHLTTAVFLTAATFTLLYIPLFAARNAYRHEGGTATKLLAIYASTAAALAILPAKNISITQPYRTATEYLAYIIGAFTLLLLASKDVPRRPTRGIKIVLAALATSILALVAAEAALHVFTGIPQISAQHILLGTPYLLLAPAVMAAPFGFTNWKNRAVATSLTVSLTAAEAYALFAPTALPPLQYRLLSFLIPFLSIMAAEGIRLLLPRGTRILPAAIAASAALALLAASQSMLGLEDPYTSVQVYTRKDVAQLEFLAGRAQGETVAGDTKTCYASTWFGLKCDPQCLLHETQECARTLTVIHSYNARYGFYLFDEPIRIKRSWTQTSILYSSGEARVAWKD